MKTNRKSLYAIVAVFLFWNSVFFSESIFKKNHIINDVVSYYGYLPAIVLHQDMTLDFTKKNPSFFADKYWPELAPNGGKVIKTTMGLSIMYAPFFLTGHMFAGWFGLPCDGYSAPYQFFVLLSCIFWMTTGLIFLRKLLLKYYPDAIAALVILSVYFGTNLIWYSCGEPLTAHAYIFSLTCLLLFLTVKIHESPALETVIGLGLVAGMLTLIRPTMIILMLFPLLYSIQGRTSLREKYNFIIGHKWKFLALLFAFFLVQLPQLYYWKVNTGSWIYYSYTGERFYFLQPHLIDGLFSYRKGWLLYTPIMVFALAGFIFKKYFSPHFFLATLIPLVISIYVIFSWWAWWYGGSFGLRALIDFYGLLSIPLAAFYRFIFKEGNMGVKIIFSIALAALIGFNLFQNWQYYHGYIHYDGMTKKAYFTGIFQTTYEKGWWESIERPNYNQARKGLPEYVKGKSENEIKELLLEKNFDEDLNTGDSVYLDSSNTGKTGKCFHIISDREFSPDFIFTGRDLLDKRAQSVVAGINFYSSRNLQEQDFLLVISFENDSGCYKYAGIDLSAIKPKTGKWNRIEVVETMEALKNPDDKIKIYLWNKRKNEIYIDNFTVWMNRPRID